MSLCRQRATRAFLHQGVIVDNRCEMDTKHHIVMLRCLSAVLCVVSVDELQQSVLPPGFRAITLRELTRPEDFGALKFAITFITVCRLSSTIHPFAATTPLVSLWQPVSLSLHNGNHLSALCRAPLRRVMARRRCLACLSNEASPSIRLHSQRMENSEMSFAVKHQSQDMKDTLLPQHLCGDTRLLLPNGRNYRVHRQGERSKKSILQTHVFLAAHRSYRIRCLLVKARCIRP